MKSDAADSGVKLVVAQELDKDGLMVDVVAPKYSCDHQLILYIQWIQQNYASSVSRKQKELKKMQSSSERRIATMFLKLEELIYGKAEHARIKELVNTKRSEAIALKKAAKALTAAALPTQPLLTASPTAERDARVLSSGENSESDDENVSLSNANASRFSQDVLSQHNSGRSRPSRFLGDMSDNSSQSGSEHDDDEPSNPKNIKYGVFGQALLGKFLNINCLKF
jgi:hypothetical protein